MSTRIVKFVNFTDKDFTYTWDGVPYDFPAGSTTNMEDWKAAHFAKHLIDRELVQDEKRMNIESVRLDMFHKAVIIPGSAPEVSDSKAQTDIANMQKDANAGGESASSTAEQTASDEQESESEANQSTENKTDEGDFEGLKD